MFGLIVLGTIAIVAGASYCMVVDNNGTFTDGGTAVVGCVAATASGVVFQHDFNDTAAPYFSLSVPANVGCADGQREGFANLASFHCVV